MTTPLEIDKSCKRCLWLNAQWLYADGDFRTIARRSFQSGKERVYKDKILAAKATMIREKTRLADHLVWHDEHPDIDFYVWRDSQETELQDDNASR